MPCFDSVHSCGDKTFETFCFSSGLGRHDQFSLPSWRGTNSVVLHSDTLILLVLCENRRPDRPDDPIPISLSILVSQSENISRKEETEEEKTEKEKKEEIAF